MDIIVNRLPRGLFFIVCNVFCAEKYDNFSESRTRKKQFVESLQTRFSQGIPTLIINTTQGQLKPIDVSCTMVHIFIPHLQAVSTFYKENYENARPITSIYAFHFETNLQAIKRSFPKRFDTEVLKILHQEDPSRVKRNYEKLKIHPDIAAQFDKAVDKIFSASALDEQPKAWVLKVPCKRKAK